MIKKENKFQDKNYKPSYNQLLPHLKLSLKNNVPSIFFLPGDPKRLDIFQQFSDSFTLLNENREFKSAAGIFKGMSFGVCSTGIGGGSTEIAIVELARLGVRNLIRVGGCGSIQEWVKPGDIVINSGCVRLGGSSSFYVRSEFPAVADPFLVYALSSACQRLDQNYHVGIGATINSYYEGQGRLALKGRQNIQGEKLMAEMIKDRVLNYDMESETILTISYLLGMKAASILVVHGNVKNNSWLTDYKSAQERAVKISLETLTILNKLRSDSKK